MRPTIRELLHDAACRGVGMRVVGDRVRITWQCGVHPDLRQRIRAARDELLVVLAEPPEDHDDPRWALAVLAHVDTWRAWMVACAARHGRCGPPNNAAGFAAYRLVVGVA